MGKTVRPGVLERDEAHQHVAVRALAADLVGVDARGLVAVVAVGDQQLGVAERVLDRGDRVGVGDPPEPVRGALVVGRLAPGLAADVRLERRPGRAARVGVQSEDRGEVRARGARQPEAVLLGPGVRALVRADAARGRSPRRARGRRSRAARGAAAGCVVVLRERPQRGRVVAHDRALGLPLREGPPAAA